MASTRRTAACDAQAGFSLIEIVIAMLVLALMALALMPMMISSLKLGVVNREIVSATSLANQLVTDARREGAGGCAALSAWAGRHDLAPSGSGFAAESTASCPSTYPGAARVSVTVGPDGDASRTLIKLTTKVMVPNA